MKENVSDFYVSRKSMNKPIYYVGVDGTTLMIVLGGGMAVLVIFSMIISNLLIGVALVPIYIGIMLSFFASRYGKEYKEKKIENPLSRDLELTMSVKEFRDQDNIMRKL